MTRGRVMVVGAGALGARHVQAMARVKTPIDVDIVDPVAAARDRAAALLQAGGGLQEGTVRLFGRTEEADAAPDLAIVATNSRERPDAIRALLALGARTMILEKVLFTRLIDYDEIGAAFDAVGVRAWVNCPRNAYPQVNRLRELARDEKVKYCVDGEGWGLACNLIHHLDEFVSLAGDKPIALDAARLDPLLADSKRAGYVEVFGRISGTTPAGATFEAICRRGGEVARTVAIRSGDRRITIYPNQQLGIEEGRKLWTEPFPMTPQSILTASYVEDILRGALPKLPAYSEAATLHRVMLDAFLGHIRRVRDDATIDECPVT